VKGKGSAPSPLLMMSAIIRHRMICRLLAAVVLTVALASCSKQPRIEEARLSIKPDTADFGTIDTSDPVAFREVSLTVRNLGKSPLVIEHIRFPEGFSYMLIPRQEIQAGGKALLTITMDTRRFSGTVRETVYLNSNDPDQPRLPIDLKATIIGERTGQVFEVGNEPDIEFDHRSFDMGTIGRAQTVEHEFTFKNAGKRPLTIYKIETMCTCLSGRPTLSTIQPGNSAAIIARLEAFNYEGTRPDKMLLVTTNDPDEPTVNLNIRAHIIDMATLDPPAIVMPDIRSGQTASAEAKLIQRAAQALLIKDIQSSSPHVSVTSSPLKGEQQGFLLTVTISGDMPEGMFDEIITIETNYEGYSKQEPRSDQSIEAHKNYATLQLPVKGSVTGVLSIVPKKINFGFHEPGASSLRRLTLSTSSPDLQIISVSVNDRSLHVSHSTVEAGRKFEILVEFLAGPDAREIKDDLTVTTNQGNVIVPIFAGVKPH